MYCFFNSHCNKYCNKLEILSTVKVENILQAVLSLFDLRCVLCLVPAGSISSSVYMSQISVTSIL